MNAYRIILADDHVLLRQGLRRILETRTDFEVVGEVGDGFALLDLLKETPADIVILDISMPNLWGIEAAREIKRDYPGLKILILSMHKEYLFAALDAKVDGYLLKENADTELFSAIERISQGGAYISPDLSETMIERLLRTPKEPVPVEKEVITPREKEILKLIAEGKSSREIAALLSLSPRTVEHHRANMLDKFKVRNVVDLVKCAIQKGYI